MSSSWQFWSQSGWLKPVLAQISTDPVATGLRNPVAVVADPTHATSFFVVEQEGLVRIIRDRQVLGEPFLDLRSAIATGGERGLLGIALAPDFADSRRFFVNFTNRNGDTVIARFRRSETNPLRADPHRASICCGRASIERSISRLPITTAVTWPSGRTATSMSASATVAAAAIR